MQVKLSSNSWHAKLHIWTFGRVEMRHNLCPYFWLTVFCIIVSPFVALGKFVKVSVLKVLGVIDNIVEHFENKKKAIEITKIETSAKALSVQDAYVLFRDLFITWEGGLAYNWASFNEKQHEVWKLWAATNQGWGALFDQQKDQLEEFYNSVLNARAEKEKLRRKLIDDRELAHKKRQKVINAIAMSTQKIVLVFAYGLAAAIVSFFLYGIISVFIITPWLAIMGAILFIVGALGAIVSLLGLLKVAVDKFDDYALNKFMLEKKEKRPGLFKLYFQAAKENYCPKIEWE